MSVPEQIAVLLALSADLFDHVPLDQMADAELALHQAAKDIPADVRERLNTAEKLSDEDREKIIQIARNALAPFQPKPEAEAEPKPEAKVVAKPEAKPKPESKPGPEKKAE